MIETNNELLRILKGILDTSDMDLLWSHDCPLVFVDYINDSDTNWYIGTTMNFSALTTTLL